MFPSENKERAPEFTGSLRRFPRRLVGWEGNTPYPSPKPLEAYCPIGQFGTLKFLIIDSPTVHDTWRDFNLIRIHTQIVLYFDAYS